jgi:L-asparaginase/Glu-tRNA(Gln) amidotransferase subunit D
MKIGVVITGGTIAGSVIDNVVASSADRDASARSLLSALESKSDLLVRSPLSVMSEDMEPSDWVVIARAVHELTSEGVQGVLILHGTDTAAFTCAALSFMCASLSIPVVVTGSNQPADQPHSDAVNNMIGAIVALGNLPRGCFLSFAGGEQETSRVFAGARVRKLHAGGQPYQSVGAPIVASVEMDGRFLLNVSAKGLLELPSAPPPTELGIDKGVTLCSLYPGFDFRGLDYLVEERGYRTVVLQLYGSLSAPTSSTDIDCATFASRCRDRGVTVIGCPHEPPVGSLLDYESTVKLREAGVVIAPTMLPEVAYVKAVWLGHLGLGKDEFLSRFMSPVATEFYAEQG